jgi:cobalt-zinc-cadmium efflux system membrane fusion protein
MLRVPGHIALADNRSWRVGVRTDGLIAEVSVGAGDFVRKEQVLARYHADELRDSRAQYRAAQLELARAESAAVVAGRNSARAEKLLELKAASQQQVEQATQDLVTAQTTVRTAQNEVDRLKGLLENDLHVQVETKAGDETADQVPIIAPASGYILEKNVTPGKAIHTDDDAFLIGDLSQVWMLASVRQDQLAPLRRGQSVRVDVPGIAGQVFDGTLPDLGQQLDPATRTMQVRIVLNNSRNALRPGMLATAEIPAGEPRTTVLVPSDAVQQIDGQDVVFVRTAPDRFAVRQVETAATANGDTAIVHGLKDGEQVVVRGSFVLKSQLLRAAIEAGE